MKPSPTNHYLYNKHLTPYANKLRKDMTKAEACLWKYVLRAGGVQGFTFRRQRPVLKYIADFMCKELMLIIEVDGITHSFEQVAQHDEVRQNELEQVGFRVIRFTDEEVLSSIECVRSEIEDVVMSIVKNSGVTPKIRKRNQNR